MLSSLPLLSAAGLLRAQQAAQQTSTPPAQAPAAADGQPAAKFATDVKLVNVFATVRDKKGAIVTNLNQADFTLTEDGRAQVIKYFSRENNLPLSLGLMVDR